MSEGLAGAPAGEGAAPEAGGMPVQAAPPFKRFFLVEYFEEVRRGLSWMRTSPKPEKPITAKVRGGLVKWSKQRKARIGMAVLVAIVVASYGLFGVQAGSTDVVDKPVPVGPGPTGNNATQTFSGRVAENSNTSQAMPLQVGRLSTMRATLTWTDESAGALLVNQADALGIAVRAPNGMNWTKAPATTSPVTWTLDDVTKDYLVGDWNLTVLGGAMGDITRAGGLPGPCPRCSQDTGNAFTLLVEAAW